MPKPVIVFDFDGVLAKPWTHPEKPYDCIPDIMRLMSETGYILCVASYNPRAKLAIESWKPNINENTFKAIRCGANHIWSDLYLEEWRKEMSKSKMIASMLQELGLAEDYPVIMFDDDQMNIDEVNKLQNCTAFLIDSEKGFSSIDCDVLLKIIN